MFGFSPQETAVALFAIAMIIFFAWKVHKGSKSSGGTGGGGTKPGGPPKQRN